MEDKLILNDLIDKIYTTYQQENKRDKRYFSRLGASGIGKECLRAVFYSWRGFTDKEFPGRILRLFQTGHIQEDRIVADLQKAGVKVWAVTPEGRQFTFTDPSGHFVAKVDGIVQGVIEGSTENMLLEIKTMADKPFNKLLKSGIGEQHNFQTHAGMWLVGLNFGLYVVLNKNNEQYYIEIIERDKKIINQLQDRLNKLIMLGNTAPAGVSDKGSSFICRWCDHRSVCTGVTKPVKSCRSCVFVQPVAEGQWLCEKHGISLNMKEQIKGCKKYLEFGK